MPEGRLAQAIAAARAKGRAAFIPYITAGDPNLEATADFVESLAKAGADIVELGVPFSDPIADGPVNQKAAERALASGTSLDNIFTTVERLRRRGAAIPIVLFTYFNPIHSMGLENFARRARSAGVDGVLVVDLPPEEAGPHIEAARAADLETVFLASPTTSVCRLSLINDASSGFVYYVSRLGVTGERPELSKTLAQEIARVRRHVTVPLAVGFGISTPEQAASVGGLADAVVVGSALVRLIAENPPEIARELLGRRAAAMVGALEKEAV